jgi:hypothetical protein
VGKTNGSSIALNACYFRMRADLRGGQTEFRFTGSEGAILARVVITPSTGDVTYYSYDDYDESLGNIYPTTGGFVNLGFYCNISSHYLQISINGTLDGRNVYFGYDLGYTTIDYMDIYVQPWSSLYIDDIYIDDAAWPTLPSGSVSEAGYCTATVTPLCADLWGIFENELCSVSVTPLCTDLWGMFENAYSSTTVTPLVREHVGYKYTANGLEFSDSLERGGMRTVQ